MKKTFPAFFCLLIFVILSCGKDAINNGDKLVRIRMVGRDWPESEYFYDDSGRMTRYITYQSGGIIGTETTNSYDNAGRLTRQTLFMNVGPYGLGTPKMDTGYNELIYGADGRLSETRFYRKVNGIMQIGGKLTPGYDAQGRTIVVTYTDANNAFFSKHAYQYNAQNNISVDDFYQYNLTQPYSRYEYEYDERKNPLYNNTWAPPFTINQNNVKKTTVTAYYSTVGQYIPAGISGSLFTNYKEYTHSGYPSLFNYNEADYVYEYRF